MHFSRRLSNGVPRLDRAVDKFPLEISQNWPIFLISLYPVPPTEGACAYPLDPGIALRGSQTIYPLNRDFCLILTNLEYARTERLGERRVRCLNFRF